MAVVAQRDPWAIFPDAPAEAAAQPAANDPWDQFPDAEVPAAPAAVAPQSPSLAGKMADVVQGTAEVPLSVASGAIAQPLSGIAGLASMATKALGLTDADPADVVRKAQELLTYQPTSESGRGAVATVAKPFEAFAAGAESLGDKTLEATGSPALATAVRTAPDAALALLGARGAPKGSAPALKPDAGSADLAGAAPKGGIPDAVGPRVPEQTKPARTPVEVARAAGYKLKPSEAGGKVGKVAEGLSGAAKLERDLVGTNQAVTHKLVAEEIGLPADTQRFTPSVLTQAKAPHNAVYDEVGTKLGTWNASPDFVSELGNALPTRGATQKVKEQVGNLIEQFSRPAWNGKDAIQEVRKLRASSTKRIRSDDPDVQSFGYAERRVADAIEDEMTRQAGVIGEPDLMKRLATAREALAKIHTVDAARTGTEVSGVKLAAQAKKGRPLSGRLKLVADVASEFPTVMRTTAGMKDKVPVNMTETMVGGGLSALGHNLAAGATFMARPVTRAVLTSDLYQNRFGPVAPRLGPDSPLGEYFASKAPRTEAAPAPQGPVGPSIEFQPTAARANAAAPESMLRAQQLAGKLELTPEPVPGAVQLPQAPARLGDLIAEAPPPIRGDLPFTPSQPLAATLADELGLAPEYRGGGLNFTPDQAPRAAGMADNVPGTTLYPELRAVRDRAMKPEGELALADELAPEWRLAEINRRGEAFEAQRAAAAEDASSGYRVEPLSSENVVLKSPREKAAETPAQRVARTPGETVEFVGNELGGKNLSAYDLKKKARTIAREKFAGKKIANDGHEILIPWSGIRHGLSGKVSKAAAIAMTKLDEVLEAGRLAESVPDKSGRKDVKVVHYYETPILIEGEPTNIRAVVRELDSGRRYYDHFELLDETTPPTGAASPNPGEVGRSSNLGGASRSGAGSIPANPAGKDPDGRKSSTPGEHIELRGRNVKRRKAGIEHIETEDSGS